MQVPWSTSWNWKEIPEYDGEGVDEDENMDDIGRRKKLGQFWCLMSVFIYPPSSYIWYLT